MAAKSILTPYDFNLNEIKNHRLHQIAGDGSFTTEGILFWNSVTHVPKVYNGSVVVDLTNPILLNSQAGSFYLARANHTGTQLAATISNLAATVQAYTLDLFAAPAGNVSWNSQKITNLAPGTAGTDAINLNQLQAQSQGFAWKNSVRAATLVTGTLATAFANGQVIDGITLVTADRILIKNQTAHADDGIYTVNASGAPTRAVDADTIAELENATVMVNEGTQAGTAWNQTVELVTLGTTAQAWVQFASGTALTFTAPLLLTGNTVSLTIAARLVVTGGTTLDLASTIVTPGTYTKVTIDTYGRTTAGAEIVSSTGILVNTAAGTYTTRTITGTSARITVTNGDGVSGNPTLDISTSYVGQATITTLGTIVTGVWTGTSIAVANGGTGATTAAGARTNLAATGKYSALFGDGVASTYTFAQATHLLATNGQMTVQLQDASTGALVDADISIANGTGTVTVIMAPVPASNAFRIIIIG